MGDECSMSRACIWTAGLFGLKNLGWLRTVRLDVEPTLLFPYSQISRQSKLDIMFESCLPLELGRHIVEVGNLTKKDFVVLSNVSRLFRNEAQRALFRDPGHFYLGAVRDSERTEAFFDAIISSPRRLALMVHTYSQDTRWYDYSWEECGPSCDQEQEVI